MKLYDSRRAPNPRRVRWFMVEKGIDDVEIVDIDLFKDEHRTDAYLSSVGIPYVPALTMDDGTTITESVAICRYLESIYPEPNLFGRTPKEAAIVEMWTRRAEMMLANPLMLAVRHGHPAIAVLETQVREVSEFNLQVADKALPLFDGRLAESEFIGGDRLTIADIIAAIGIDFARIIRFKPPEHLTHVHRWRDAMMARAAASAGS